MLLLQQHMFNKKYVDLLGPVNNYAYITVLKCLAFTYHPGVQFLLHRDHSEVSIPCTHLPSTTATLDDLQFLGSGCSTAPDLDFTGSGCYHSNGCFSHSAWPANNPPNKGTFNIKTVSQKNASSLFPEKNCQLWYEKVCSFSAAYFNPLSSLALQFPPQGFITAWPVQIPVWVVTPTLLSFSTSVMVMMPTLAWGWNYSILFFINDYLTFKQMLASERRPRLTTGIDVQTQQRSPGGNLRCITF